MKKTLGKLLTLSAILLMAGCSSDQQTNSSSTNTVKESTSKTEQTTTASTAASSDATSGASAQEYTDPAEMKDTYDVVIVGAGGAGMAAALSAKEAGANPVILEKMPIAGGNTLKSSAGMNASETKFQDAQGIKDSNDKFYEESLAGGGGTNDPQLLRYLVDHSAAAIDWLDSMDITLDNLTTTGGMSVKRTHRPTDGSAVGEYLVDGLLRNVHENEIPLFVNSDVVKINEADGTVNGVQVKVDGKEKTIAAKAVIVTTGGFGANMDMIEQYKPELKGYVTTNQEGSTGDGIKMIEALGGQTVDMDQIQIHPTVDQTKSLLITEAVRGEGAILVNQAGKRFFNEMETRDKVSAAIIDLPEKSAWLVFDAGVKERVKAIDFYEKSGLVKSADTIEALAKEIDMPEADLKATLDTWNKAVADKDDAQFGRTTGMDNDLSKAPYYAIAIAPGIHHTMGGVKINTETQVIGEGDKAIPALYAAGEVTGGIHGNNRIGGNAVADIIIFGRQAGTQAAKYAVK
ncbi:flavocytochrome c [Enterococcus diestrammenae]|uniref:Fumarate reductase flavoprotein subunit n=1 Tax=Enterococcus diestrammenae TaxID=1155073 RepID=A0ABV0F8T6_9ENTE|nr:flavocytochrome c [Enterococcus diestrammenae]KAF1295476.1 flavocytochrome c [Enterococcus diestrammenae]